MARRVLMFPWPVGAGHTGRCLHLAERLIHAGHLVSFAHDPTNSMVAGAGLPVLGRSVLRRIPSPARGYVTVTGPADAFAAAGYYHPRMVADQVAEDRRLLREHRADLVVTHMNPTCVIAARAEGVPVLSVADADFLVTGPTPWMPWLPAGVRSPSPFPDPMPAFRQVQRELGQQPAQEAGDLLTGDAVLIASVPELERPDRRYRALPSLHYVGPMIWDPDREGLLERRLAGFGDGAPLRVYASVGGGQVAASLLASGVADAARARGWALLLAGGIGEEGGTREGNVLRQRFGGITAACAWADVVVCHGGHSTVLAALAAGKPVVVAPAMSENEANGRQLVADRGAGLVMATTVAGPDGRLRVRPLGAEPLPVAEGLRAALSAEAFADTVEKVAADGGMRDRAGHLSGVLDAARRASYALLPQVLADLPHPSPQVPHPPPHVPHPSPHLPHPTPHPPRPAGPAGPAPVPQPSSRSERG